jgi:hypothetical protein
VMQLVEEGKLDLAAPISRYLQGLPYSWQPITIRQLLTHVSGLPNILSILDPVTYGLPRRIWGVGSSPYSRASCCTRSLLSTHSGRRELSITGSQRCGPWAG